MTEQEWYELGCEYRAVFGESIPHMMLPADEEAAAALVREAIEQNDSRVFERDIPPDALI